MNKIIATTNAPAAVGPYSQAIEAGGLVFTSGQLGLVPETGVLAEGVEAQARQSLMNVKAVVEAAGLTMDNVAKTTVFLADINDFAKVNAIYAEFFNEGSFPARSAVGVAALPKGGLVEIETICVK
ncbi:MAG: RidA family protein [Firmicutes bacterium]|nr:RidA family protein [Bacillota bacterium]MBR6473568.1 RidA family protein [Bacillota bacterium]